jgi:hypothetical protein
MDRVELPSTLGRQTEWERGHPIGIGSVADQSGRVSVVAHNRQVGLADGPIRLLDPVVQYSTPSPPQYDVSDPRTEPGQRGNPHDPEVMIQEHATGHHERPFGEILAGKRQ